MIFDIYGIYAFLNRKLLSYLFLKNHFYFINFQELLVQCLIDYFSIMLLVGTIGYMITFCLKRSLKNKRNNKKI